MISKCRRKKWGVNRDFFDPCSHLSKLASSNFAHGLLTEIKPISKSSTKMSINGRKHADTHDCFTFLSGTSSPKRAKTAKLWPNRNRFSLVHDERCCGSTTVEENICQLPERQVGGTLSLLLHKLYTTGQSKTATEDAGHWGWQ